MCVVGQSQARGVNGDGRQHHGLGLRHGEVLHGDLLEASWQGVERRSGQVADDQRGQHRQHARAGHLPGSTSYSPGLTVPILSRPSVVLNQPAQRL